MPIYEYQCEKCGTFEMTQRITDSPLRRCPKCRAKVRKLISQTSFQLKGSGWYVTDYASKGNGKSEEKSGSKDSPASTESTASSASEKPAPGKSSAKTGSKSEATAA